MSLLGLSPLKLSVDADIPVSGTSLEMDKTYPAELTELAAKGWLALISDLSAKDSLGDSVDLAPASKNAWNLSRSVRGRLKCSYVVDYSLFAAKGWSSPLESAFMEGNWAIVVGRSVFITTPLVSSARVEFRTPEGWRPIVPWGTSTQAAGIYNVQSKESLTNNALVFSKIAPDTATISGFRLQIIAMGHWQPLASLISQSLRVIVQREVDIMQFTGTEIYDVVLLPIVDEGGNAFHQTFIYCYNSPDSSNCAEWSNTLAHEIFHYWNYIKLRGADYASSQWFQEGFTEYVANIVVVTGGIADSDAFLRKLGEHVSDYRKLTTTLENPGSHKGPPLYSAGALVAFMWDVLIRNATHGRRNIGNLFRNLMVQTNAGARPYSWADIKAALGSTADYDWESFFQSYVRGNVPLPFDEVLPLVGLRLSRSTGGNEEISRDPAASKEASALFRAIVAK